MTDIAKYYFNLVESKVLNNCYAKIIITATLLGIGIKVIRKVIQARKKKQRLQESLRPENKDVVILHQFPRGVNLPNVSPFPVKVESYLKLANIAYKNDHRDFMSPKGKCPYITLNGVDISDSQLIIEFLNERFNIDLNVGLTEEQKAIGHAFRIMMEEHLYWPLVLHRWVYDKGNSIMKLSRWQGYLVPFIAKAVGSRIKSSAYGQGMGRHTKEEVTQIAIQDLRAISKFLGKKPFLLGDKITEYDCGVFGILIQVLWTMPGTVFEEIMNGECSNLRDYCLRMKEKVWPDWDDHIRPQKQ